MNTQVRLPDLPSVLLRLALEDLEKVENDKRYEVDMNVWVQREQDICYVCFAGAVMAETLDATEEDIFGWGTCTDKDAYSKLLALDRFRTGNIDGAYRELGRHKPDSIPLYAFDAWLVNCDVNGEYDGTGKTTSYKDNRNLWWNYMLDLVGMLEAFNE
jgi:ribosomal protein S27AE